MAEWQANWWLRNQRTKIGDWSITDGKTQVLVPGCKRDNVRCERTAMMIVSFLNQANFWETNKEEYPDHDKD